MKLSLGDKINQVKDISKVKNSVNSYLTRNARIGHNNAGRKAIPKTKMTKKTRREMISSWIFLTPSLVGVGVFFVLPFFVVIFYSIVNNPIQKEFVGFDNFVRVWNNQAFQLAASNTAKFSLIAVPLAVVLSLILAIVMESKIPFKSGFRSFFLSPMMVPTASIVLIWQVLFHYNGLVNVLIGHFGVDKIDWLKSADAQIVIIVLFLWKNLGYNMILFMAALSSVPKDLIEVARLESASEFQIFWTIKMRYLSSTVLFVTIMSLINSFKVFREIYLMTGDYPYDTLYMMQHFMNNTFASVDYQKLSAAAIIMALVIVILVAIMFITEDRYGKDIEG
jgi:multiple sugar transport system permease protein